MEAFSSKNIYYHVTILKLAYVYIMDSTVDVENIWLFNYRILVLTLSVYACSSLSYESIKIPPPLNFNAIITVIFNHQLHIVHKATRYSRFLYSIFIQTQ